MNCIVLNAASGSSTSESTGDATEDELFVEIASDVADEEKVLELVAGGGGILSNVDPLLAQRESRFPPEGVLFVDEGRLGGGSNDALGRGGTTNRAG